MSDSTRHPLPPTRESGSGGFVRPVRESGIGRRIGPYRTLRELGRGAFGVVFLAQHETEGQRVALKMLLRAGDSEELQRFQREGDLAARLDHPGIVRVCARGVHQDKPWLAMDYCPGSNLREQLQLGALSPHAACALVDRVADAIEFAHSQGVLHRDLKPANVLLDAQGHPRVTDFGLAVRQGDSNLTRSGDGLGSPLYMPPEQFSDAKNVDVRADVYALGLLLYECLTANRPFEGNTVVELTRVIHSGTIVPLRTRNPNVPAGLAAVSERAFQRVPEERFQSVRAFREALRAETPPAPKTRGSTSSRRSNTSSRRAAATSTGRRRPVAAPYTPQAVSAPRPSRLSAPVLVLVGLALGLAIAVGVTAAVLVGRANAASAEARRVARAWAVEGDAEKAREAERYMRSIGVEDAEVKAAVSLLEAVQQAETALDSGDAAPARALLDQGPVGELTPWLEARQAHLGLLVRAQDAMDDPAAPGLERTIRELLAAPKAEPIRDRLGERLLDEARAVSRQKAKLEAVLRILTQARSVAADSSLRDRIELEVASVNFRRGKLAQATALAQRLIQAPGRVGLQARYVAAYGKVWRDELQREGLEELRDLWQLDLDGVVGLNAGAVYHSHTGKNAQGERMALKALELDPDYVDAYISLGFCLSDQYGRTGDRSFLVRSEDASSRAIALMPDHPRAYLARAFATGNLGREDDSLQAYTDLIALTEPQPMDRALRYRGKLYLRKGQLDLALRDLSRALRRNTAHPEALLWRGVVYHQLKRHKDAREDWVRGAQADQRTFVAHAQRLPPELKKVVSDVLQAASNRPKGR